MKKFVYASPLVLLVASEIVMAGTPLGLALGVALPFAGPVMALVAGVSLVFGIRWLRHKHSD